MGAHKLKTLRKTVEYLVDVSNLGPVKEGTRVLAKRSCHLCYGTGIKGFKISEPVKFPDKEITTQNKKCPKHIVRVNPIYETRTPVFCTCLKEYQKEGAI